MGGVKKKSMASMEKTQDSQSAAEQAETPAAKGKKGEKKSAPQQKKQLAFLAPRMTDAEMVKSLTPMKAITIHSASKALGVNASVAAGVLRDLEAKAMLRRAGGFSGHTVWAVPS
ncbi:MAG TPA: hypothetical protein VFE91_03735 [Nitrososphaerales archaeon]|nr:hypothetical protein [Nitrososphaerales archaeon]